MSVSLSILTLQSVAKLIRTPNTTKITLDELPDVLIAAGVLRDKANLAPAKFGYKTLEELFDSQPEKLFHFDKATRTILPPQATTKPVRR